MAITRNAASVANKPNIYEPYAFDATQDYVFEFNYSGPQVQKNRLVIRDNESNTVVYDQKIRMMALEHLLPANTLTNGKTYNATIFVYDTFDTESPESNPVIFFCFTQPRFETTNLSQNDRVYNSSYEIQFVYEQLEGEPLDSYHLVLFNSLGEIIHNSGTKYPNMGTVSSEIFTYTITALDDNAEYSIQIIGETLNHMVVDTGRIFFTVEYTNPSVFAILDLTNIAREGQIKIQSNIVSIEGRSYPDPPRYIRGQEVDLRGHDDGGQHRVWFDDGFSIRRDFTLQMIIRDPNDYSTLVEFNDYPISLELKYMKGKFENQGDQEVAYVSLRVYNQLTAYYLQSNYFEPLDISERYLHVWVRCIGDVYELIAEPLHKVNYENSYFYLDVSRLDVDVLG